jgi:hypothetical protein
MGIDTNPCFTQPPSSVHRGTYTQGCPMCGTSPSVRHVYRNLPCTLLRAHSMWRCRHNDPSTCSVNQGHDGTDSCVDIRGLVNLTSIDLEPRRELCSIITPSICLAYTAGDEMSSKVYHYLIRARIVSIECTSICQWNGRLSECAIVLQNWLEYVNTPLANLES